MSPITKRAGWLALCSLLLFLGLTGCKKDEAAKPTTGGISGTVSPVGSVLTVVATDEGGLTFQATPNATDGAFSLAALKPGKYTLSATPASGYYQPSDRQLTVEAGETVNAGTIIVSSDGRFKSGTVSWTIGGTTYTVTNPQGNVDTFNRTFGLSASSTTGAVTDQLQIGLGTIFNGAGDYAIGSSAYASAVYNRSTNGQSQGTYRSNSSSSSGTFRVLTYDATAGTMSGTFSLTLPAEPGTGAGGTLTITNGTFSVRF